MMAQEKQVLVLMAGVDDDRLRWLKHAFEYIEIPAEHYDFVPQVEGVEEDYAVSIYFPTRIDEDLVMSARFVCEIVLEMQNTAAVFRNNIDPWWAIPKKLPPGIGAFCHATYLMAWKLRAMSAMDFPVAMRFLDLLATITDERWNQSHTSRSRVNELCNALQLDKGPAKAISFMKFIESDVLKNLGTNIPDYAGIPISEAVERILSK